MEVKAPEKIYIDRYSSFACEPNDDNIEYIRTDVFIEKAEGWLRDVQKGFILTDKDITDFVKYMKGE